MYQQHPYPVLDETPIYTLTSDLPLLINEDTTLSINEVNWPSNRYVRPVSGLGVVAVLIMLPPW